VILHMEDKRKMRHITSLLFTKTTLIHFPVGMVTAALTIHSPLAGALLFFGFMAYEIIEAVQIKDLAHRDMFGFLVGFASMVYVVEIIKVVVQINGS